MTFTELLLYPSMMRVCVCVRLNVHTEFFFVLSTWCEAYSGEKRLQYNEGFRAREHICHVIFVQQRERERERRVPLLLLLSKKKFG